MMASQTTALQIDRRSLSLDARDKCINRTTKSIPPLFVMVARSNEQIHTYDLWHSQVEEHGVEERGEQTVRTVEVSEG